MTSWRGYEDGGPHLGRRGLTWFRSFVRGILREALKKGAVVAKQETLEALLETMVDWYTERVEEFVYWHTDAEYHGARYSWGRWKCRKLSPRILEAYNDVCAAVGLPPLPTVATLPASTKPSREQPIPPGPIDMEAALQELEHPTTRAPREGHSRTLLRQRDGEAAANRHYKQRLRFERNMPRVCKTCGETFTSAVAAVTCQTCKKARRKRCCRCGEVFAVESAKEKRCEPCIEKAAKGGDVAAAALLARKRAAGGRRRRAEP
jgi:hypothetical protein